VHGGGVRSYIRRELQLRGGGHAAARRGDVREAVQRPQLHAAGRVRAQLRAAFVTHIAHERVLQLNGDARARHGLAALAEQVQAVAGAEERAAKVDAVREKFVVQAAEIAKVDPEAGNALRAVALGEKRSAHYALRALTKSSNTVATTFADFIVQYLTSIAPVYDVARKLRTTTGGDIVIPRVTANQSVAWIGEGSTITAADPTISSVTLGAYKLASITLLSSELANDASFPIEQVIGEHAGRQIALVAGSAFTLGTGTSQPTGFITAATTAGALSTATKGGTGVPSTFFDAADVVGLLYALEPMYRNVDTRIMASTTAMAKLRKLQDTTGQFLFSPSLTENTPDRFAGYSLLENVSMAAVGSASKSVAVLHGPSFIVREVGQVEVARSEDRYFETDQIAIRTLYRVDSNLLDTNAVRVLVSANS
jgi:HK97 family phage major capsid protein